jgi:hypothetical protein
MYVAAHHASDLPRSRVMVETSCRRPHTTMTCIITRSVVKPGFYQWGPIGQMVERNYTVHDVLTKVRCVQRGLYLAACLMHMH